MKEEKKKERGNIEKQMGNVVTVFFKTALEVKDNQNSNAGFTFCVKCHGFYSDDGNNRRSGNMQDYKCSQCIQN